MRFVRGIAALVLLTTAVHAEQSRPRDPRIALAEQLAAELQTLAKTVTTVAEKVDAAQAARLRRIRAAYRILRAPLSARDDTSEASRAAGDADRIASARRRAAARLLLERDRAERELLADEVTQLRAAETTLRAANDSQLPVVSFPVALLSPAKGTIARRFGTIVHERSKTKLARRGIDFEVATAAAAVAPADGVVLYAGVVRGLEHGVVLDHGDFVTIIAKLGDAAIPIGTKVTRGDRIGRAARQRVYFEVRAKVGPGGLPIDPEPLLK